MLDMNALISELRDVIGGMVNSVGYNNSVLRNRAPTKVDYVEFFHIGCNWKVYLQPTAMFDRICQVTDYQRALEILNRNKEINQSMDRIAVTVYYANFILSLETLDTSRLKRLVDLFKMPYGELLVDAVDIALYHTVKESVEADPLSYISTYSSVVPSETQRHSLEVSAVIREYARSLI